MTLALKILLGFIFHFIGDYLTQNNWLAQKKTSDIKIAFLHALIYSLPFLLFINLSSPLSFIGWLVIFISHGLIDRYRLAQYWIKLVNWSWSETENFGYGSKTPAWLSTWLMIIIDNTWHIIINTLMIFLFM